MNEQGFDKDHTTNGQTDNKADGQTDMSNESNMDTADDIIGQALNSDDSVPGTQHLDDAIDDNEEVEKLKRELSEAKDKYVRLLAEFENVRRRTAKEKEELRQTAGKDIVQSLLVVLDDTDRAAKQMESSEDLNQIKEGISLVFNKLRSTLQAKGLRKMESKGAEFNPDLHEAITEIPAPAPDMAGKVIDEIEPGYYLNDKLIRYAKVIVGK